MRAREARPRTTAPTAGPGRPVLTAGTPYSAPWSVQDAVDDGSRQATAGLFDEDWGDNRRPTTPDTIAESVAVGQGLVAIDHGRDRAALRSQAWAHLGAHVARVQQTHAALDVLERAMHEQEEVHAAAQEAGLPHPQPETTRRRAATLATEAAVALTLAVPEVFLMAPAFDALNLSDQPLIGGLHWTDERHVAALGCVLALIVIAHLIGRRLPVAAWRTGAAVRAARRARQLPSRIWTAPALTLEESS